MWHLYQTIQIPCHYPRLKTCSQSNNMCNTRSLIQRPSKLTNKKQYNHHRTNQQITRMQVWCSMKHTRWSSVQWKPICNHWNKKITRKICHLLASLNPEWIILVHGKMCCLRVTFLGCKSAKNMQSRRNNYLQRQMQLFSLTGEDISSSPCFQ